MRASSRAIRSELENLLGVLLDSGVAIHTNTVADDGSRVSWHALDRTRPFLENHGAPSIEVYRNWVAAGHYSAILGDGALIQITYDTSAGMLTGHRLAYVPCPWSLDPDMLISDPVLDVLDLHMNEQPLGFSLSSVVRFDFDLQAAAFGHPAAHLTLNSMDCRIACRGPLRLGHFASFIFKHFYPETWTTLPYLQGMSTKDWGNKTVTSEESQGLHIAWAA